MDRWREKGKAQRGSSLVTTDCCWLLLPVSKCKDHPGQRTVFFEFPRKDDAMLCWLCVLAIFGHEEHAWYGAIILNQAHARLVGSFLPHSGHVFSVLKSHSSLPFSSIFVHMLRK